MGHTTRSLFAKTHGGDYARRAAGTFLIHFVMPFDQLLCEILLIVEAPHFEEGRFYEAHQVLDSSFGEKRALQTVVVMAHKFSPSRILSIL